MRRAVLISLALGLAAAWPARAQGEPAAIGAAPRRGPAAQRSGRKGAPAIRGRGRVTIHPDWATHPATRYAALDADACRAEASRRSLEVTAVESAPGVLAPVRIPNGVGGVVFRTAAPAHQRASSPFDVFDCRIVLALHDWSALLRAHDVEEVLIFSAWRPGRHASGAPERRHPGGLAIDAYRFVKRADPISGARASLDVDRDFHGTPGAPPCGPGAPPPRPESIEARELRSIVCEAADQHLFTVMLTPHYDRHHKNHLHLELTPDVPWHLVR